MQLSLSSPKLRNILWFSADKLFKAGSNVIIMLLLAGYGPHAFGAFNYALMMGGLLYTITAVGNESLAIARITVLPKAIKQVLQIAFLYRVKVFAGAVLLYLLITFTSTAVPVQNSLMLICMGLPALSEVPEALYQAELQINRAVIPRMIILLLGFSAKLYIVFSGFSLVWLILAYAAESLFIFLAASLVFSLLIKPRLPAESSTAGLRLPFEKASAPLLLATVAAVLYTRIDVLVLEKLSSALELGYFTFANRIGEALYFLPLGISSSFMASFVKSFPEEGHSPDTRFIKRYTFIMLLTGLGCTLLIITMGLAAIEYHFGPDYYPSRPVLLLYAGCVPFVALGLLTNQYLIIAKKERVVLYRYILGFVANLIFNLLLVPPYGAMGAALSTLSAFILVNLFHPFLSPSAKPLLKAILSNNKAI